MTDLRFPYGGASIAHGSSRLPKRVGFLQRFIAALHHSRRIQATVVIRRYRHLVDPGCGYQAPGESTKGSSANADK
jgi:hypothetical protein